MKLSGTDKKILETLFEMRNGTVLDFSDRRMKDFFYEEFEIDIYDEKYDFDFPSKSKANRLRGIWQKEDEKTVGKIILSLIEYQETSILIGNRGIPENTKDLIERARVIGAQLQFSDIIEDFQPIIKTFTDKSAIVKNFNAIDFKVLKTNEKIHLLKVLYSYYEAILRAYHGSGLFLLTAGIDDLNDYFKVLRKRMIELFNSDDTFLNVRNSDAYTQSIQGISGLYSSVDWLDVLWENVIEPALIYLREEISEKDLFENNSEIHSVNVAIPILLEKISKEIEVMKKYLQQREKRFQEEDLSNHKKTFENVFNEKTEKEKKEDVIRHEHTHRHSFENSIQEKDIILSYRQEKSQEKPKIKLSDYEISFDDETAQLHIGDFETVSFPSHKNEHYVMRKLFSQRKNEAIDWEEIYEAMTLTKSTTILGEEIERQKKSVKDAVRAINARVKEVCNTESDLLLLETKCIKRLY